MIPYDPDTDGPPTETQRRVAFAAIVVTFLLVVAFITWASLHAVSGAAPPDTMPAPTSSWQLPDVVTTAPVLPSITEAATATEPARRVTTTTTTTTTAVPFDCERYVDALAYEYHNLAPVHDAYRVTAQCLGWPLEVVDRWETFIVDDVIDGESGGCWNLRGGTDLSTTPVGRPCSAIKVDGTREDSGFAQLIGLWWRGPGTPVCDRLGLCSSGAVVASPWNSMRAALVAVEHDGRHPWCFNARARSLHRMCATVPRSWP